jgi:Protein of unknown function (DUF2442)
MPIKSPNTGQSSSHKKKEKVKSIEDIALAPTINSEKADMIVNKRAADPFDRLVFENGLRVKQILADKNLDTMLILLSNAKALQVPIHHFERLKNASQDDLNNWELIDNGIGIRWVNIDEDLSLKALLKESALNKLAGKKDIEELIVL